MLGGQQVSHPELDDRTYREVECNGLSKGLEAANPGIGGTAIARYTTMDHLARQAANAMPIGNTQHLPDRVC